MGSATTEDHVHLVSKARLKRYKLRFLLIEYTHIIYRLFVTVDAPCWSPRFHAGRRYSALTHVCGPLRHVDIRGYLICAMRIRLRVPRVSFSRRSSVHVERRWSAISVVRKKRFLAVNHVGVPSNVDFIRANSCAMPVRVRHVRQSAGNRASFGRFSLCLFAT